MFALGTAHTIHYRLTDMEDGVRLRVWEPAPKNTQRLNPYFFMVNYVLASEAEAQRVLNLYLQTNGSRALISAKLSPEGKIRVLPDPTWPTEESGPSPEESASSIDVPD